VGRVLWLSLLAPVIVEAILGGRATLGAADAAVSGGVAGAIAHSRSLRALD